MLSKSINYKMSWWPAEGRMTTEESRGQQRRWWLRDERWVVTGKCYLAREIIVGSSTGGYFLFPTVFSVGN